MGNARFAQMECYLALEDGLWFSLQLRRAMSVSPRSYELSLRTFYRHDKRKRGRKGYSSGYSVSKHSMPLKALDECQY